MAFRFKMVCLALALLLFIPVATIGAERSLIFYILDGSGSMWGRVDGKIKIQVAKEVMTTLLKETPEGYRLRHHGLWAPKKGGLCRH